MTGEGVAILIFVVCVICLKGLAGYVGWKIGQWL